MYILVEFIARVLKKRERPKRGGIPKSHVIQNNCNMDMQNNFGIQWA
jgi:hypothetical protein